MSSRPSDSGDRAHRRPSRPKPTLSGHLKAVLGWSLLLLLVVVAVGAAYLRHLADNIDDYRPAVEEVLSDRLGQPVTIHELTADWRGPDPVLQASGVRLTHAGEPEKEAATLQHLLLRLDGPRSLLRLALVFERIEADGLELVVARDEQGRFTPDGIRLNGFSPEEPDPNEDTLDRWLDPERWLDELTRRISDPHIRLTHFTLGLRAPDTDAIYVDIPQLDLVYEGGAVRASGRAMRQGTLNQVARFSVRGRGLLEGRFTGDAWAEITPGGFFEGITRGMEWEGFQILELEANADTWLRFEEGRLRKLNGRLELPLFQVSNELNTLPPLKNLTADIGWQATEAGGRMAIANLGWDWHGDSVAGVDARVEYTDDDIRVEAARVPVGEIARVAVAAEMLPARAVVELGYYQPEGTLSSFRLSLPWQKPEDFEIAAGLDGVSVQAHHGAPAGGNLRGTVWLNRHGGRAVLEGQDMTLYFPQLYADPWTIREASGKVGWRLDGGIIRVFGSGLDMHYQEQTRLTGAFDLRLDRYGEDNLGLRVTIANATADMLPDLVPVGAVDPGLYDWLTTAIIDGEVVSGEFRAHGQIGRDKPPFSFSTAQSYRFRNARVRYDPKWPEVTDANGAVTINNGHTRVVLESANTGGISLQGGEVTVAPEGGPTEVRVAANTRVNGDQVAYWLRETPLGDMAGEAADTVSVSGDFDVELGLGIPLDTSVPVRVSAAIATENGEVHYPGADLHWQNLSGQLRYTSADGFDTNSFNARFLDEPVTVSLRAPPGEQRLSVIQSGQAELGELVSQAMGEQAAFPGIEGRLPYRAQLDIAAEAPVRLAITANGAGLWSEWPGPLSRQAGPEETIDAVLQWHSPQRLTLRGTWGERLGVALDWRDGRFWSGEVTVGQTNADLPVASGLEVDATMGQFAPTRWKPWLERLKVFAAGFTETPDESTTVETLPPPRDWLNQVRLSADQLILGDQRLPGFSATLRPESGGWLITTDSERITGRIRVSRGEDLVWVDLARLQLERSPDPEDPAVASVPELLTPSEQLRAFYEMRAGEWPSVDVRIESLVLGDDPAGSWSFVLDSEPERIALRDLQGQLGSLAFAGQLSWGVGSGEEVTALRGVLEGGGLQDLSGLLGEPMPLTNEGSILDLDVAWAGRPDQFTAGRLNGEFTLRLNDGVILESNNTAQLFRVFNLLNTDTLQRRLKFDFSDLYEAGIAFDAIYGKGALNEGVLRWKPDLQLAGPSGALRLSGATNLADKSLDMRLVVILPLTQNLPLAAILLGASPPVGGALFVLDKLLGEPLSRLTSATYSVKGTWENPEVTLRNIFDTGNQD
ncbi:TIGR02099 family protein [Marinobacter daqiaonensis]|uniref:TIGR02099 family protein n=1 Tax=Marinobacter daqiaonensis TaxID=650891 RepID=A0A1I6HCH9_9GAMM|nr:YhdP family protein [Marinobacter daqiaonensis]SFR51997.1 TIGR02099 family protein [Marinobacter daqiaonensis]